MLLLLPLSQRNDAGRRRQPARPDTQVRLTTVLQERALFSFFFLVVFRGAFLVSHVTSRLQISESFHLQNGRPRARVASTREELSGTDEEQGFGYHLSGGEKNKGGNNCAQGQLVEIPLTPRHLGPVSVVNDGGTSATIQI